jgi:hypothetical protein
MVPWLEAVGLRTIDDERNVRDVFAMYAEWGTGLLRCEEKLAAAGVCDGL